jgi:hypothetical protein
MWQFIEFIGEMQKDENSIHKDIKINVLYQIPETTFRIPVKRGQQKREKLIKRLSIFVYP